MTAVLNTFAGAGMSDGIGTASNAPFPSVVCRSATLPRPDVAGGVTFTRGVDAGTMRIGAASEYTSSRRAPVDACAFTYAAIARFAFANGADEQFEYQTLVDAHRRETGSSGSVPAGGSTVAGCDCNVTRPRVRPPVVRATVTSTSCHVAAGSESCAAAGHVNVMSPAVPVTAFDIGAAYCEAPDPTVTVTSPAVVDDAPHSVTDRAFPDACWKLRMSNTKLTPAPAPDTGTPVAVVDAEVSDSAWTRVVPAGVDHVPVEDNSANGVDVGDGVDVSPGVPGVPGSVVPVPLPVHVCHCAAPTDGTNVATSTPAGVNRTSPVVRPFAKVGRFDASTNAT